MNYKVCSKCNKTKNLFAYNWRNESRGWRHSFCKDCHSEYRHLHYLENRNKYLVKARSWNKKQTGVLREFIVKYLKANPCVDCGNNDIRVLDFDHEGSKFMGVGQMVRNCYSIKAIEFEIAKCKIRCANCHRIKTFVRGKFWKEKIGP